MPSMRAFVAATQRRGRSASLSTIPPAEGDDEYLPELAAIAASILYKSPLKSLEGRPVYVLNAAAFPDAFEVDYDSLLAYVLARLPGEEELIAGADYEIVFFAGGPLDNATTERKQGPSTGWYLQAYHVLSRATRKKLQRLYIVHPRTWVRVLINVFGTIVSPKFRRKIVHVNSLSQLALHLPLQRLLIPPSAYLQDRKVSPDVYDPFNTGRRAFGVRHPLPKNIDTRRTRLPRVLRETTSFILIDSNVRTEGLFRIPPHNILSAAMREAYERGQRFIVWKEKNATYASPDMDPHLLEEVRMEDAYGVHLAASLIKTWYRELRDPVIPESSYAWFKAQYEDPKVTITADELVGMISPASDCSPLTHTAREILIRHLLPLLSTVTAYEASNKMNAENLAICFSMGLVCGSNQIEDGKMSTIVRRVLQAAIEAWPELRSRMELDHNSFLADIQAPADPREYEDPLEDAAQKPRVVNENDEKLGEHRIHMKEAYRSADFAHEHVPPPLPARRVASWAKAVTLPDIDLRNFPKPKIELPSLPRRKAAHQHDLPSPSAEESATAESPAVQDPPTYSALFSSARRNVMVDSPAEYSPAERVRHPRTAGPGFEGDEQKPQIPPSHSDSLAKVDVPRRKALSPELQIPSPDNISAEQTPDGSRTASPSEANMTLARIAAQQVANQLAQRTAAQGSSAVIDTDDIISTAAQGDRQSGSEGEGVFRKPSWPASANRQPNIQSLAKPVLPVRQTQGLPIITGPGGGSGGSGLSAPPVPKPRTPSPGLLRRMSSMEGPDSRPSLTVGGLEPRRMEPKRLKSVEDLKRLYEERVNTAQTLASVSTRRSSHNQ